MFEVFFPFEVSSKDAECKTKVYTSFGLFLAARDVSGIDCTHEKWEKKRQGRRENWHVNIRLHDKKVPQLCAEYTNSLSATCAPRRVKGQ